jgi:transcriptional regulator with XRE-family HTH domain
MKYKADSFWGRVKVLMRSHKISQERFAAYIGVSFGTFKEWLPFNRLPDIYTACDIADALGVSVDYLARGKDGTRISLENRKKIIYLRKTAIASIKKMATKIIKDIHSIR